MVAENPLYFFNTINSNKIQAYKKNFVPLQKY